MYKYSKNHEHSRQHRYSEVYNYSKGSNIRSPILHSPESHSTPSYTTQCICYCNLCCCKDRPVFTAISIYVVFKFWVHAVMDLLDITTLYKPVMRVSSWHQSLSSSKEQSAFCTKRQQDCSKIRAICFP